jgi:hypothetical protein
MGESSATLDPLWCCSIATPIEQDTVIIWHEPDPP